jgi:hypothetical protein
MKLQEQLGTFSANSASIVAQLSELIRLQEQVREAQEAASKSIKRKPDNHR